MILALSIILLVVSVVLIVAVLMQSGKSRNLSGAISGGSDTFFGKTKGNTRDAIVNKITTVTSIIFVIVVLVFYVATSSNSANKHNSSGLQEDIVATETSESSGN